MTVYRTHIHTEKESETRGECRSEIFSHSFTICTPFHRLGGRQFGVVTTVSVCLYEVNGSFLQDEPPPNGFNGHRAGTGNWL